jgi:hypothetical protein
VPELGEGDRQVAAKVGLQHPPLEAGEELVDEFARLGVAVDGEQHPGRRR